MMADSVNTLIVKLCELHLGVEQRAYISQPRLTHQQKKSRLKKTAWDNIFLYLKGSHRKHGSEMPLGEVSRMFMLAFEMRQQRRFDDANQLEQLVEHLTKDGLSDNLRNVFKVLIQLNDIQNFQKHGLLGHELRKLPVILPGSTLPRVLPDGPLCYGDTCFQRKDESYFMHYPREIFEVGVAQQVAPMYETHSKVFFEKPGDGLAGNGIFNVKGDLQDRYEKDVRQTLFGALTYSRTTSMDIVLDLPVIQDTWDKQLLDRHVPKISDSTEDEGFVDRTPSLTTSSCGTPLESSILEEEEEDLWDLALKYKPSKYRTWEKRGWAPCVREKLYATEAGLEVLDELHELHQLQLRLLDPTIPKVTLTKVTMAALVKDTINMLIGVPSRIFTLDEEKFKFIMKPGIYISGMSPEGVTNACLPLMTCGTQYVRLAEFSHPPVMDSHYGAGLIFQAFCGGVRTYLQHYRGAVLSFPRGKTLLEIKVLINNLSNQIWFLSELCRCTRDGPGPSVSPNPPANFPTGVRLLSYLYKETLDTCASVHYPMMMSLVNASCGPYIMFVRDWVFGGLCRDAYGEFMIQMNEDYLRFRDKHYWTQGYVLVSQKSEEAVPLFLQELANDIFVCGKSVNLLRLVEPEHFLFSLEGETPSVTITFSEEELYSIERQCKIYLSRMQEIARQHSKLRAERLREEEQAKLDIIVEARKAAMMATTRYQAYVRDIRKAQDRKKRAAFQELKTQMEKDLKRRANVREQEREEDAARVAATTRQELLEVAFEEELEQKARQDIVEHYAQLTAEASYREQRALWKVARHRLDARRIEFLAQEEDMLDEELSQKPLSRAGVASPEKATEVRDKVVGNKDGEDFPDGVDKGIQVGHPNIVQPTQPQRILHGVTLPEWAMGESRNTEPVEKTKPGDDTEQEDNMVVTSVKHLEADLPQWAMEGLKKPTPAFGLGPVDEDSMPSWARNSDKTDDKALIVQGDDDDAVDAAQKSTKAGEHVEKPKKTVSWSQETVPEQEKQGVKSVSGLHVSRETSEQEPPTKHSVRMNTRISATQESSQECDFMLHKKTVVGQSISLQSTGTEQISRRIKCFPTKGNQESSEKDHIPSKKAVAGHFVSQQSQPEVSRPLLKKSLAMNATKESEPQEHPRSTVKMSMFSHVSQLSLYDFDNITPTRKPVPVYMDADFGCYQIKPHRKSVIDSPDHPMRKDRYASKESEYVDMDGVRRKRFKATNVHGHSSDSTVQRLLYGESFGVRKISKARSIEEFHEDYDLEPWSESRLQNYTDDFDILGETPVVDLMNSMQKGTYTDMGDYGISTSANIGAHKFVSLPALLKRSVTGPLQAQILLVNRCLVTYFFQELQIENHFVALRRFLLMQDGEFGQCLSDQLFEKLATNPKPHEMLNPMYLNNVLSRALRSSIHGDTGHASQVNFALKYIPSILRHHAPNALDCLELTYKVDWPLNIVVTDTGLAKYSRVFSFMLQLKRAVWVLKDVWHRLKRDAIINHASTSPQFRKLQLYRHEMTHFVKVMQGYIANQVIHVTWREFQDNLAHQVETVDDLHHYHSDYLNKCIFRCLLNKKAGPVMKIIEDIFALILKFRTQLVSHEWQSTDDVNSVSHPSFDKMCAVHKAFEDYTRFLFKVVSKLAMRGYQPHLQELLLRLNFNSFYNEQ